MLHRLLYFSLFLWGIYGSLDSFKEEFVMKFVNESEKLDVSKECRDSLMRVWPYLNAPDTLYAQKNYYHEAFGRGPARLFTNKDEDRWMHRGLKCVHAAGQTSYSKSAEPMHFCYGMNEEGQSITDAYMICIPTPCEKDHHKLLALWQSMSSHGAEQKPLDYSTCSASRHEKQWFEKPVPVGDFIFNVLLSLFVVLATVFHHKRGEEMRGIAFRILLCFSLKTNLKKLIQMPKDPQSTITCMIGLRVLTMTWTLIGHSFIFVQAYMDNVDDFKNEMVDNFFNQWINNFTLSVDVFLTLGGCVLSYTWFRKWSKKTSEPEPTWSSYGYWLRFYRHRIVRLWPAYLYALMTITLRLSVTHHHPLWPETDPSIQCPKYWYQNVLFINSLFSSRCMFWTWYIGTEFIYYLISPIFLLSLRQSKTIGLSVCLATIAISGCLNTYSMVKNNFPPTQIQWKEPEIFNPDFIQHFIQLYIKPQFRIGPYIIGILLGYYLANYQNPSTKPFPRSTRYVVLGWMGASICIFWSVYGVYPSLQGWNWPIYHIVYGSVHRVVFSMGLAWLIYACHTGIGGFVNDFLSWKCFLPLSNLSYSAYLFHMMPVHFTYLHSSFPIDFFSKVYLFGHCVVQLAISYLLAFICASSVEYPALNIERILLHDTLRKSTLKPVQTAENKL